MVKTARRAASISRTYFVRRRARDTWSGLDFDGAPEVAALPLACSKPSPAPALVILCPSNPFISIGPILAVPGIREALRRTAAPVAAISPIVGGTRAERSGSPYDEEHGTRSHRPPRWPALYRDFVDVFVLDQADAKLAPQVEALGMRAMVTNTIMSGVPQRKALARAVLRAVGSHEVRASCR